MQLLKMLFGIDLRRLSKNTIELTKRSPKKKLTPLLSPKKRLLLSQPNKLELEPIKLKLNKLRPPSPIMIAPSQRRNNKLLRKKLISPMTEVKQDRQWRMKGIDYGIAIFKKYFL